MSRLPPDIGTNVVPMSANTVETVAHRTVNGRPEIHSEKTSFAAVLDTDNRRLVIRHQKWRAVQGQQPPAIAMYPRDAEKALVPLSRPEVMHETAFETIDIPSHMTPEWEAKTQQRWNRMDEPRHDAEAMDWIRRTRNRKPGEPLPHVRYMGVAPEDLPLNFKNRDHLIAVERQRQAKLIKPKDPDATMPVKKLDKLIAKLKKNFVRRGDLTGPGINPNTPEIGAPTAEAAAAIFSQPTEKAQAVLQTVSGSVSGPQSQHSRPARANPPPITGGHDIPWRFSVPGQTGAEFSARQHSRNADFVVPMTKAGDVDLQALDVRLDQAFRPDWHPNPFAHHLVQAATTPRRDQKVTSGRPPAWRRVLASSVRHTLRFLRIAGRSSTRA